MNVEKITAGEQLKDLSEMRCWGELACSPERIEEQRLLRELIKTSGLQLCPYVGRIVEKGVLVLAYCGALRDKLRKEHSKKYEPHDFETPNVRDARIDSRIGPNALNARCLGNFEKCGGYHA